MNKWSSQLYNMFSSLAILVLIIEPVLPGIIKNQSRHCRNSSLVLGDTFSRSKRQSECLRDQWQCRDGTCIPVYAKCDGLVDCPDGSDETYALCRNSVCPDKLFRCTYGPCVDSTAPCNGERDCADNSDELLHRCLNKTRIVGTQFKCDSGQDILVTGMCDGEVDCEDGSDETIEACAGTICDSNLFQCAYGACVDKNSDCNGKQECADSSDESDELCNRTSTNEVISEQKLMSHIRPNDCQLPPQPANGWYNSSVENSALIINVSCNPGYAVDGSSLKTLPCVNEYYKFMLDDVPQCKRYCELPFHQSVEYTCSRNYNMGTVIGPCNRKEFVGTTVVPKCNTPNFRGSPSHMLCTEGQWDYIAKCIPECGRVTPLGKPNAIGGQNTKHGELPWHAAIYTKERNKFVQICGGSLVSATAVISAAHCFWEDDEIRPPNNYLVALGKIYRRWNHPKDTGVQYSNVTVIYIPITFRGDSSNYQADIAIVKLEKEIIFKPYIRPVCYRLNYKFNTRQLKPDNLGKIAGWGLTENGKPATVLQKLELPFVEFDKCFDDAPEEFKENISDDKFCAGYVSGATLCEGDSGGGLAFPEIEQGSPRYYLQGIVSTSLRSNNLCDSSVRPTFTNIIKHEYFIKHHLKVEWQDFS